MYHFIRKQSGICSAYSRRYGMWKRPGDDSGTENLIIKISQTRCAEIVFGRSSGNSVCFCYPPPPGGPFPLCKHQYRRSLCHCMCLFDGEKRGKNCQEKNKIKYVPSFLQVTAITRVFLSVRVRLQNFSNRKACVKKYKKK